MSSRRLTVDGLANARDLGGLPRSGGGTTPFGVFVRSETPDLVTPEGWEALHALGVRTVVDLRQQEERDRDAGARPAWLRILHVDHDGLSEHPEFWTDYWETGLVGTALYYLPHIEALPERTRAVLRAIAAAPPGGVLFHCAAGRDRTGLIAAILLAAAGVREEAIVADYLDSIANAEALAALQGRENPEPETDALLAARGVTTEGSFRDALVGLPLEELLAGLAPAERRAIETWRGHLPKGTVLRA